MRPLIGITGALRLRTIDGIQKNKVSLRTEYTEAVIAAGGAPIVLPLATDESARATMSRLDGLILSGGTDIPGECFGAAPHPSCQYMPAERWLSECLWLRTAQELGVLVLGICLGMQVINIASGGTLIQDLPTERPDAQPHERQGIGHQHEVIVEERSWLSAVAPSLTVTVTSAHHQAVDRLANGYRITGRTDDGMIEAIEHEGDPFVIGVQWHPERCLDQPNWLLEGFVKAAGGVSPDKYALDLHPKP